MSNYVQISPEAMEIYERMRSTRQRVPAAIARRMARENVLTVSHIQRDYLSFSSSGPSQPNGLRVQTGSLRRSLRASAPVISGQVVTSGIGGNVTKKGVNYLAVHEMGATIPPHEISATQARALCFFKGGQKFLRKKVRHPGMVLPARGMIHKGIKDRLPAYGAAVSEAIVETFKGEK